MTSSNQPARRPRSLQPVPDVDEITFGTWLRRQRELREISLREIADVTKISIRYLEALERDRFDILPAPVFARGFLREYARYVGLDPDEVVNSYLSAQKSAEPEEEEISPLHRRSSRSERTSRLFLVAAVVLVLAVVAAIAFYVKRQKTAAGPERSSVTAPAVPASAQLPAPHQKKRLAQIDTVQSVTIDFTGDCWIEAVVDDGRRLSELHVAGESLRVEAKERVILTLDNPEAVQIEVNGQPFPVEPDSTAIPSVIRIDFTATKAEGQ